MITSSIGPDSEKTLYFKALSLFSQANPEQKRNWLHFRGTSSTKAFCVLDTVILSRHEYWEKSATRLALSTLCSDPVQDLHQLKASLSESTPAGILLRQREQEELLQGLFHLKGALPYNSPHRDAELNLSTTTAKLQLLHDQKTSRQVQQWPDP